MAIQSWQSTKSGESWYKMTAFLAGAAMLAGLSGAAAQDGWRWTVQAAAQASGLASEYVFYLDGPASSTTLTSKKQWFFSALGGVERPLGRAFRAGAMLGYAQTGFGELQETYSSAGDQERNNERYLLHQLVLPMYAAWQFVRLGDAGLFLQPTLSPGIRLAEGGQAAGLTPQLLNARFFQLAGDVQLGVSFRLGSRELRAGVVVLGATLLPFDGAGNERLRWQGVCLQFSGIGASTL